MAATKEHHICRLQTQLCAPVSDAITGKAQTRTTEVPNRDSADAEMSAARAVADLQVAGTQSSLRRMIWGRASRVVHTI